MFGKDQAGFKILEKGIFETDFLIQMFLGKKIKTLPSNQQFRAGLHQHSTSIIAENRILLHMNTVIFV